MLRKGIIFIVDRDGDIKDWLSHNCVIDEAFQVSRRWDFLEPDDSPHTIIMWNGSTFVPVEG